MATPTPPKSPKSAILKACNDPTRDDWGVLSKLLRDRNNPDAPVFQHTPEGLSPSQAKAKLEALLLQAYAQNCDELVTAACWLGKSPDKTALLRDKWELFGGGNAGRMAFYETVKTRLLMPEDGINRESSRLKQAEAREAVVVDLKAGLVPAADIEKAQAEVTAALAQNRIPVAERKAALDEARLALGMGGSPEEARSLVLKELVLRHMAKARTVSSYNMLQYWQADRLGVLPYVRERIGHITHLYVEEQAAKNKMVSFTTLGETNTEVVLDAEGVGQVARHGKAGPDDDYDAQEMHERDHDIADDSRFALPVSEVGEGGPVVEGGALGEVLVPLTEDDPVVRSLGKLLDSLYSGEGKNASPLFDAEVVATLEANEVSVQLFNDMKPFMAKQGETENRLELDARVTVEMQVASELVRAMGGVARFPADLGIRWEEAEHEFSAETNELDDELGAANSATRGAKTKGVSQALTPEQMAAYVFGQNRKQLTAYAKANRPEFELFGLILGETVTPAESPEARCVQLAQLARRVALEKCQDMNTAEDKAVGATVENAVEEWNPATSSFGRLYPDILDHLESGVTRDLEAQAALRAEQAKRGQDDFFGALGEAPASLSPARLSNGEQVRPRALPTMGHDVKTVEELLRDPDLQAEFAIHNALETGFWCATCTEQEELDSPERIDYRFLSSKLGLEVNEDIEGEELHAAVKHRAQEWVSKIVSAREEAGRVSGRLNLDSAGGESMEEQFNRGLVTVAADYNAGSDGFFSQVINEYLRKHLSLDRERIEQHLAKQQGLEEGDESVAMHHLDAPLHAEDLMALAAPAGRSGKTDYHGD